MTSTKQCDTERKDNHTREKFETYKITISESNIGTMALNDELISNSRLYLNDNVDNDNSVEKKSNQYLQDQSPVINPGNNSRDSFELAFNNVNNIIVENLIKFITKKHDEGI